MMMSQFDRHLIRFIEIKLEEAILDKEMHELREKIWPNDDTFASGEWLGQIRVMNAQIGNMRSILAVAQKLLGDNNGT
jgi:hypothetical protein